MGQEPSIMLPAGLFDLASLLEAEWPARRAALHASGVPLMEGDDDGEGDDGGGDGGDSGAGDGERGDGGKPETFGADYVKKLRDENAKWRREAQEARARAQEYEDQNKTEAQKLEERAAAAEKKAADAQSSSLRLEVALDKAPEGMPIAQVRKLAKRLTGSTKEELEQDADELFADFTSGSGQEPPAGRPRERLRPGAAPSSELEETDPEKLAAMVPRRYR